MKHFIPPTVISVPDPGIPAFHPSWQADSVQRHAALDRMILSASGWRAVFAASGNEESSEQAISCGYRELCASMCVAFAKFFKEKTRKQNPVIALGMDTRPTGPTIADILVRGLLVHEVEIRYLHIAAAPEIMAWVKTNPDLDGFIYVSASHNPIGHNGIKLGLGDGEVLGGVLSKRLIEDFKRFAAQDFEVQAIINRICKLAPAAIKAVYDDNTVHKAAALLAYERFTREIAAMGGPALEALAQGIKTSPAGIVADFNGSARALSIDKAMFESIGIRFQSFNDVPGLIAHRIVPEGSSLDPCREALEVAWKKDPSFQLGYVPDCDGDRGNIVYMDPDQGKARIMEAQEGFALACVAELSFLRWSGALPADGSVKAAVVVNDATSGRIATIASLFGVETHVAEVGEANVVNCAAALREQGYLVRILGEGSNGGTITHPGTVRDPLNSIIALLKLMRLGSTKQPGPLAIWLSLCGLKPRRTNADVPFLLSTLPAWRTVSAYEPEARMDIRTTDHAVLKQRYEKIFLREWKARKAELEAREIFGWEEQNAEGTVTRSGFGPEYRSGTQRGGLKIVLYGKDKAPVGFLWMRGSGTEAVFRILADVRGNKPELLEWLLHWHRAMLAEADQ